MTYGAPWDPAGRAAGGRPSFEQAVAFHKRGRLPEAERIYKAVVKADSRHFGALYHLGLIHLQQGQLGDAERWFRRALKIDGNSAETHHHLGIVLAGLRRTEEAIKQYEQALAVRPGLAETHNNLGHALEWLGRLEEAREHYERALAIKPAYPEARNNYGNLLHLLGRSDEAAIQLEQALALNPRYGEAQANLGRVLTDLNQLDEAIAHYRQALAIDPANADAHICIGNVLHMLGRSEEALAHCEKAAKGTLDAIGMNNVANLLWTLDQGDEALRYYDRALTLRPDETLILVNRANCVARLGRFEEALAGYAKAQTLEPDNTDAIFAESTLRLRLGDFQLGLPKFEWRLKREERPESTHDFDEAPWLGQHDIKGKTILVHAEQGLGDTLQFCRYAERLAVMGAKVVLEVQPPLKSLLASLAGVGSIVAWGEQLPHFDFHCPVMSLPLAFRTTLETIPAKTPYLRASPDLVAKWEQKLGARKGLRVGLVWSGNPLQPNDANRSMPLSHFLPLFRPGIQLISLHKEVRSRDLEFLHAHGDLMHFGDELRDFSDTAALVSAMDLVISVCTSVGHLSGALNKPTWLLLSAAADWRWLLRRNDSPWYPSARLFRQPKLGDWTSVIENVAGELVGLVGPATTFAR